jgi:aspartate dehydrogenase
VVDAADDAAARVHDADNTTNRAGYAAAAVAAASPAPMRVGLIGCGAIGGVIVDALGRGAIPGATLSGVLRRHATAEPPTVSSVDELVAGCDVVVEAASHAALAAHGPAVVRAGRDLVVLSVGALADDRLCESLSVPNGGRVLLSTGACGGVDLLRAAHALRPLDAVTLRTTKSGTAVARDWMEPDLQRRLVDGDEPVVAFSGPARDAVRLFPETANIAALLALATIGLDRLAVTVVGDPRRTSAQHEIRARGAAGEYRFEIENAVSPTNPRTSAVTAYAVVRALADRAGMFTPGW